MRAAIFDYPMSSLNRARTGDGLTSVYKSLEYPRRGREGETMEYISRIFILSSFVAGCLFTQAAMSGTQEQVKIFSLLKADTQPRPGLPELNDPLVYGVSW